MILENVVDTGEMEDNKSGEKDNRKKEKKKKKSKGVETMLRIMAGNNMRLSKMADDKAQFLLSINSVIISVLLALVLRNINEEPYFIIPSVIFLITSLITFVFAVLVSMPIITHGVFHKADIKSKKANLLFFGNFHKMDVKDYQWAVNEMMDDPEFLYNGMIRDNYNLGLVLHKKYKRLRIAFGIFMFGFIISVLSFLMAIYIKNN